MRIVGAAHCGRPSFYAAGVARVTRTLAKVYTQSSGMKSVPPRGSGWLWTFGDLILAEERATRYREVVLTSCDRDLTWAQGSLLAMTDI